MSIIQISIISRDKNGKNILWMLFTIFLNSSWQGGISLLKEREAFILEDVSQKLDKLIQSNRTEVSKINIKRK